jgi:crotonobetainyl-CoA:carnitine CoA-transferase CaiB-like acyl-CoA transferase
VFLAVTTDREWVALVDALGLESALREDEELLAKTLTTKFKDAPAAEWERTLTAADVACVEVAAGPAFQVLMGADGIGRGLGLVTDVVHPVIGPHTRSTALVKFSRSATVDDGTAPRIGQQTDEILGWLGYDDAKVADLRARGIVV